MRSQEEVDGKRELRHVICRPVVRTLVGGAKRRAVHGGEWWRAPCAHAGAVEAGWERAEAVCAVGRGKWKGKGKRRGFVKPEQRLYLTSFWTAREGVESL